jgi:hypothetical protein
MSTAKKPTLREETFPSDAPATARGGGGNAVVVVRERDFEDLE